VPNTLFVVEVAWPVKPLFILPFNTQSEMPVAGVYANFLAAEVGGILIHVAHNKNERKYIDVHVTTFVCYF
jgi:hypothetical protein